MAPATQALVLSASLLVSMLVCIEIGYRIGWRSEYPAAGQAGVGAAVLGLLGLVIAFTFAAAQSRFEFSRKLIVEEANAIGTAYLRLDLLPDADQAPLRRLFRDYVNARLHVYENYADPRLFEASFAEATRLQSEIWRTATAASRGRQAALIVLPAINQMIDITTARKVALTTHTPTLVVVLLESLSLLSAVAAGYGMSARKHRSWLHILLYTLAITVTFYVVLDLDNPRVGLIRLDKADKVLWDLRDTMR